MSNNIFPKIICLDGRWFLRVTYNNGCIKEICLPNLPTMNRIWEASHNLIDVYIDDCGANRNRCVEVLRSASKAFAGISELLADEAKSLQNEIELDELYAYDPNEHWYNR